MNSYIKKLGLKFQLELSRITQQEVNMRYHYRPIYSIHKWWARRPGILFRALILLIISRMRFNEDKEMVPFTFDSKGNILKNSAIFNSYNFQDFTILDPFMGGGTTLVEANRMGVKTIGNDINPVSFWIVKETLEPLKIAKMKNYFKFLEKEVGSKILELYQTSCKRCDNQNARILYTFWVRKINCLECEESVPLLNRYLLNKGLKRTKSISQVNPATLICPKCFELNQFRGENSFQCKNCKNKIEPYGHIFAKGQYVCLNCKNEFSLIKTIQNGNSLEYKPIAIEYYCEICDDRIYKTPDNKDLELLSKLEYNYNGKRNKLRVPEQNIILGTSSKRWISHNYLYYKQIFNTRQLVAFNFLFTAIDKIEEERYRNAFVTIFSNSLEYNNMMVPYNYPHRKLHHLFNYHALPLTTMPVENNFWGISDKGAGTFRNCFMRYVKAKLYANQPFDKYKDVEGNMHNIKSKDEKIRGKMVSSIEDMGIYPKSSYLKCSDSTDLGFIPDKSIDAVITDPPYFDNIHYSELSNFFYVWLALFNLGEYFKSTTPELNQEAIVNSGQNKTHAKYIALISKVFSECHRVVKDDGFLVFTFHHKKEIAWWSIICALINADFLIESYLPVKTEYKVSPHIRGKKAIDTDLVIFCKKNSTKPMKNYSTDEIQKNVDGILSKFSEEKICITEEFIHNLCVGETVKWYCNNRNKEYNEFKVSFNLIDEIQSQLFMQYKFLDKKTIIVQKKLEL